MGEANRFDTVDARPTILIIGPVPPPAFGVAKATALMLESPILAERLRILHLDTSDRRGVANIGRLDLANAWLAFRHAVDLSRLLRAHSPQVTLLTASQGTLGLLRDAILALISRGFGSLIAVYMRGSEYADLRKTQGRLAACILRHLVKHSALVVVLGKSLVHMAQTVWADANVAVVPNGSPPAVGPEQVGFRDESHPVLVYVGRLSRLKGLDEAMEVARVVATSTPDLEFVLAGEWEPPQYEEHIRRLAQQYELEDVVLFPGPVDRQEKADLLARAWVLVLPSHSEGQPWVILEAMSAGVPVVATDTGTIAETVEDGVGGFVVPIGDTRAMADRVSDLLQDDQLRTRMSEGAALRYRENYTMEKSHRRLADELSRVAQTRRSR
jgi:glycosyltransferase involved in cell wall biosynthesis